LKLETNIIPGDKGEFNIYDTKGQLIFSKKDLGRFPETDEIISLLKSSI
jgi:predicted Rdx family selenoprotein